VTDVHGPKFNHSSSAHEDGTATSQSALSARGAFCLFSPFSAYYPMDALIVISHAPDGTRHEQSVVEQSMVMATVERLQTARHRDIRVGQDAEGAIPFHVWIVGVGLEPVDLSKSGQWRLSRRTPR
jgi:hypothetical protein